MDAKGIRQFYVAVGSIDQKLVRVSCYNDRQSPECILHGARSCLAERQWGKRHANIIILLPPAIGLKHEDNTGGAIARVTG